MDSDWKIWNTTQFEDHRSKMAGREGIKLRSEVSLALDNNIKIVGRVRITNI